MPAVRAPRPAPLPRSMPRRRCYPSKLPKSSASYPVIICPDYHGSYREYLSNFVGLPINWTLPVSKVGPYKPYKTRSDTSYSIKGKVSLIPTTLIVGHNSPIFDEYQTQSIFMAGPKLMLTELGIHHRLESFKAVLGGSRWS